VVIGWPRDLSTIEHWPKEIVGIAERSLEAWRKLEQNGTMPRQDPLYMTSLEKKKVRGDEGRKRKERDKDTSGRIHELVAEVGDNRGGEKRQRTEEEEEIGGCEYVEGCTMMEKV
jgi:hypothetical protein